MKTTIVLVSLAALLPSRASAQALGVQVRNGDVFVQQAQGWGRLTSDGQATEAAKSRDGSLVAFAHKDGGEGFDEMDSISLCVVAAQSCRVIVSPKSADAPEQNLTGAASLAFSYQARVEAGGGLMGSLFFLTNGWAISGAIHRVTLRPNPTVTFITSSNSLSVVQNGKFAGALEISQHIYAPQGGSCDQERIFDPNTKKVLQSIPTPDCQSLHIQ